jgi:hypothetical protein
MNIRHFTVGTVFILAAWTGPAWAADAKSPANPTAPVTTPRVGGSPADAAFRDAQQKSGAAFREARAACRTKPREERSACLTAARTQLKQARLDAKAKHDAARTVR